MIVKRFEIKGLLYEVPLFFNDNCNIPCLTFLSIFLYDINLNKTGWTKIL